MNPVFTLPYTELLVAERLREQFRPKQNYSVLIPLSREQKGFDLILSKRVNGESKAVTIQIKGSKAYPEEPRTTKKGKQILRFGTLFNRFEPSAYADFFVFVILYSPEPTTTKHSASAWASHFLLFTFKEMTEFLEKVRTKKDDKPDKMFGFGFNNDTDAFVTRGIAGQPDYSEHILTKRYGVISDMLECTT